jgi:hypothetical protein
LRKSARRQVVADAREPTPRSAPKSMGFLFTFEAS